MSSYKKYSLVNTTSIIALLGFLYFISGKFAFDMLHATAIVTVGVFPPEGIALAFALFFGKRVVPGIFIGQFFLAYTTGLDTIVSLEISTINSLEALLAIYMFEKYKINKELTSIRDIVALGLLVVFVLQLFSAFFSNTFLLLHGVIQFNEFFYSSFSWWFGNVMGQLLLTPFLLYLFYNYKTINFKNYLLYALLFIAYIYFIMISLAISNPFLLLWITIIASTYITLSKSVIYGTLMSVIVAVISSYSISLNIGALTILSTTDNTINYNLFILAHISIILIFGILFEEKRHHEKSLEELIEKELEKNKRQQLILLRQSRFAQMGEMISMIAHQWRQPLNNLALVNQLLVSKYSKGNLDDKSINYFKENSKKQIQLMSATIDDFRDFFKVNKTKELFYINDTIENVLNMLKSIYANYQIKLNFSSDENYQAMGNSNSLMQVILNIINNAKDALIESDVEEKKINILTKKVDSHIIISISDNAGGIPEDIIEKIFDPYFSTKSEKNGTGLGLYMSKMILTEQMDSKIEVVNHNGGADFKIYLKGEKVANA